MKKDSIIEEINFLCTRHDIIKNSEIRQKGIEGEILPPNSKERYYNKMRFFYTMVCDFLDDFQNLLEVESIYKWMKQRDINMNKIKDDLEECYALYDNDEFIAALDFMVLSKLHYIVEYSYFQITKEYFTKDFGERLKDDN